MKRFLAVAVCVFACAALFATAADAGCTNGTLHGAYGYQDSGSDGVSTFNVVGVFNFDGEGKATISFTAVYSPYQVFTGTGFGLTYDVAPDCTFTFRWDLNGQTYSGVIVDNDKQLRYVETTGFQSRSGQAMRTKSEQDKE